MLTFPLTLFLIDLHLGRLPSDDPDVLAEHYGVRREHVCGYILQRGGAR